MKIFTPNKFKEWVNSLHTIGEDEKKELISKYQKAYRTLIFAYMTIITLIVVGITLIIVSWK
jgi:predicted nucleic acid-binding Zn ribbon protein